MEESLFWADKIAEEIIGRENYSYLDKDYELPKVPRIKTSSSLSGVLHIGRLTDMVRGEAVYKALVDRGVPAEFIYVAEDMDPLRKIPKGIPKEYQEYIGVPVTDIPDPYGCHDNYGEHHIADFFKVFSDFVETNPRRFSMREEYKKGVFDESIKTVIENADKVREIINGFKDQPLSTDWIPYQVICENCGKIMTTRITGYKDGKVGYVCRDYDFKTEKAVGCGHKGELVPAGKSGKMVWKSEWASQWKVWDVVGEGAGKEYIVPNSAFFVNAHICEKVLDYPATTPIFYEHITIGGGGKMSASVGNVVYPKDWLAVAPAEALRLLFVKRITKARDFKWDDVPSLMDELDSIERIYYGVEKVSDEKEEAQAKRLYEMVLTKKPAESYEGRVPYSIAAMVSQISLGDRDREKEILRKLGYEANGRSLELVSLARNWAEKYGESIDLAGEIPDSAKELSEGQKKALLDIADAVEKDWEDKKAFAKRIFQAARDNDVKPPQLFKAIYTTLLDKPRGPKAAQFILSLDKDFVQKRFRLEK